MQLTLCRGIQIPRPLRISQAKWMILHCLVEPVYPSLLVCIHCRTCAGRWQLIICITCSVINAFGGLLPDRVGWVFVLHDYFLCETCSRKNLTVWITVQVKWIWHCRRIIFRRLRPDEAALWQWQFNFLVYV